MSDSTHPPEVKLNAPEVCIAAPAVETGGKPILRKVSLTEGAWLSAAPLRVAMALL